MKKKIIIGIAVVVVVLAAVFLGVFLFKNGETKTTAVEIKASAGEKLVYATIDQINGNDIDVTLLDEAMVERITAAGTEKDKGGKSNFSEGGMPEGGMPNFSEGGMPEMPEGGMPNFSEGERPEMPEGMQRPGRGETQSETATYRIPVGTEVITKLGAITTFSHLEEGDMIAILFDEKSDAILKIWMVM